MTRNYVKSKRAENQAETRQRIVEAAVDLHGEIGPVATTISMIAERAGVQRHTVYSHFADELSLFTACSGLHIERHPMPSPEQWAAISDPARRLAAGLSAVYAWFEENEAITRNVLRDAESSDVLRGIAAMRFGVPLLAIHASLGAALGTKGNAALGLALSFYTWRSLTRDAGLKLKDAADLMARSVLTADAK